MTDDQTIKLLLFFGVIMTEGVYARAKVLEEEEALPPDMASVIAQNWAFEDILQKPKVDAGLKVLLEQLRQMLETKEEIQHAEEKMGQEFVAKWTSLKRISDDVWETWKKRNLQERNDV